MQFSATLKDEFKCKTCSEPWDPEAVFTCTDCEAVFCKPCYDETLAKTGACLACGKAPASFKAPHRLLLSMANSLEVYCANRCHGCKWTGPRSGYTSHVSSCALHPKEFNYVDEAKIPEELRCPICHDVLMEPVALACDHIFCRKCIVTSLTKNEQCPWDRSPATPADIKAAPKFLTAMLDELPVNCEHRSSNPGPCSWTGRRRDYFGHRTVCRGGKGEPTVAAPPPPPPPAATLPPPPATVRRTDAEMRVEAIPEFPSYKGSDMSQELYVLAHVAAPKLLNVEQRKKPLAISAVIDVSGSMSGSKLQMAMDSLEFMIDELSDRDSLGIVAFQSTITEACRMVKMDHAGKTIARTAVRTLRADGCTNLSGGLKAGIDQVNLRPFAAQPKVELARKTKPKWSDSIASVLGLASSAPTRPDLSIEVTVWSSPMRRDGKNLFSYSADVKFVSGPPTAVKSMTLKGSRGDLKLASVPIPTGPSVRWDPVSAPEGSIIFTVALQPQYKESERVFVLPLADPSVGQTTRLFTIPAPPTPHRADPAATLPSTSDACGAVLLFTDGAANEGISSPAELQTALKAWLAASRSVVVHTFGFGADHNANLLRQLSEIGSGTYYFIQDVSTMKTSFADCLGGLVSTVAENITLTVKANDGFQLERVMTTLKLDADPRTGCSVVTMRDMYSEETRDILVKLKLTQPKAVGASSAPVTFSLQYDSLITGAHESAHADTAVTFATERCTAPPNVLVDQQRSRILATEAIEAARKEADSGRVEVAQRMMVAAKSAIVASASSETAYAQAMMKDCDAITAAMTDARVWGETGSKQAAQVQSCHAQQRWNAAAESEDLACYDNAFKKSCRNRSKK